MSKAREECVAPSALGFDGMPTRGFRPGLVSWAASRPKKRERADSAMVFVVLA